MLRVAFVQPAVPHYRLPVYERLGGHDDIDLTVFADPTPSTRASAEASRQFRLVFAPLRHYGRGPFRIGTQRAQLTTIDRGRFDVVVLPWNPRYVTLVPALRKARRQSMPVLLWGHGCSKRPGRVRDAWRSFLGRRADAVILYSRHVAETLVSGFGFDRSRTFVAQNAVDERPVFEAIAAWRREAGALERFQQEHRLDPRSTMIFVSRLLTQNRADLLLDATARLARRFDALRLVIVGDGPERSNLEARAQHLGIGDRVTFTGAIFEQTKLAPWMLSSTVCCYPVNIGLSLLHAFAFGLPVVTSDNLLHHGPEIAAMEHGVNGLLYRAGDIEAMAEACASILADPDRRRVMAESAQQAVRDRYNLDNMVQGLLDALSIADGRRRVIASSASTVASPAAVE